MQNGRAGRRADKSWGMKGGAISKWLGRRLTRDAGAGGRLAVTIRVVKGAGIVSCSGLKRTRPTTARSVAVDEGWWKGVGNVAREERARMNEAAGSFGDVDRWVGRMRP